MGLFVVLKKYKPVNMFLYHTIVSAGVIDADPVIKCQQLEERRHGIECGTKSLWVRLAEVLSENNGKCDEHAKH